MPQFKVKFPHPVRYLDGHPKGYTLEELIINAPNAQGALFHAIRVVTGDIGEPIVTEWVQDVSAPPVEADNAQA